MTQVSGLYLHVPFCRHLCNYCDFFKKKLENEEKQFEEFHQFLKQSWVQHERILAQEKFQWAPLDTLYFGGGTPSLWGTRGARFFKDFFLDEKKVILAPDCEFTMEVDPGTWSAEMLEEWRILGLNRISIGTQALHPDFLKIMDRDHSIDESLALLKHCQKNQWNFSLDFLLGIPFSATKKRDIQKELDTLLGFGPKHVSLYILNARSKYPHVHEIPDDEYIREEYLFVSDYLRSKGFHHYEVSNFALPGFESRHNQKYWSSTSVAGLGPTATGYLDLGGSRALRYKWKVTSPETENEFLSSSEWELERTYLELRTSEGWIPQGTTPELLDLFSQWEKRGFGSYDLGRMKLNSLGFLMLDSLMDDLFRLNLLN